MFWDDFGTKSLYCQNKKRFLNYTTQPIRKAYTKHAWKKIYIGWTLDTTANFSTMQCFYPTRIIEGSWRYCCFSSCIEDLEKMYIFLRLSEAFALLATYLISNPYKLFLTPFHVCENLWTQPKTTVRLFWFKASALRSQHFLLYRLVFLFFVFYRE